MNENKPSTAISDYALLMQKLNDQSTDVKIYAIQLLLLSHISQFHDDEVQTFLQQLSKQGIKSFLDLDEKLDDLLNSPQQITNRVKKRLSALCQMLLCDDLPGQSIYAELDNITARIEQITTDLLHAAKSFDKTVNSVDDALGVIRQQSEFQLQAINNAFDIMMHRIVESLDPESSHAYLDHSVIKVGPLKKSALFDAAKEKHDQVCAYQREGKLLRDFKILYKQELKNLKKGSQS